MNQISKGLAELCKAAANEPRPEKLMDPGRPITKGWTSEATAQESIQ